MEKSINLTEWSPPPCPKCGSDDMIHKLMSLEPASISFRATNGWYCENCNAGPFQLGKFSESDAAQFAISLLNS